MPGAMRGMRWRVAAGLVGVLMVLMWQFSGINTPVLQVEWGAIPELAGAEVVVDGEVVGTLELLRRRTRNGFKVDKGPHQVLLRWDRCPGIPDTITAVSGRPILLMADIEDRMVGSEVRCMVVLRH